MQKYITIKNEKVPALGFGTWQMEGKECFESVIDALQIGYRHIDTAQMYRNEAEVGEAMEKSGVERGEIFLTTKVWPENFSVEKFIPSVEESLKKLKTDTVDLILLHWPSKVQGEDNIALEQLQLCKEKGYTKLTGISNFSIEQTENAAKYIDVFTNQVQYHPYKNREKLLRYLQEKGIMLTAYSPLALGKIKGDEKLIEIGKKYGKSEGQIVLRWLIQQERVSAIPKASSSINRKNNFDIFDFELDENDMKEIFALSK